MDSLINDFKVSIRDFHADNFYLHEIKKLRFTINNRIRKITDIAEIKNQHEDKSYQIIVFNIDYSPLIKDELNSISLENKSEGQFIFVKKKKLTFNQLMSIVEDIEKFRNKMLTKCSKAKLEPILRARNAVENEFIDQIVSRETSNKCQQFYEITENIIFKLTQKKIRSLLGEDYYNKYLKETI